MFSQTVEKIEADNLMYLADHEKSQFLYDEVKMSNKTVATASMLAKTNRKKASFLFKKE